MSFSNLFIVSVLLAVLCPSTVDAAPSPAWAKHATHRKRVVGRGFNLDTYQPRSNFKTYGVGTELAQPQSFTEQKGLSSNTLTWIQNQLKLDNSSVAWQSGWSMNNISCGYVNQVHNDIPFANAVGNVMFKGNNVVAFGNSFVDTAKTRIASSNPTVKSEDAIATAEQLLEGNHNGAEPQLQYLARPDGSVALVHAVQVNNEEDGTFFEAYVDAHSGDVLSVNDFVAHATFKALPIQKAVIGDGLETITNPEDLEASPEGWNSDGQTDTTDTTGNNVLVFSQVGRQLEATEGVAARNGGLTFDFTYDPAQDPTDQNNIDAARTNAFFIANTFHDFTYRYGFTEKAFNFQDNNFGNGGAQGDPVLMSVQDPSGTNNANFATPPDGQSGVCRMFIWDLTNPRQDGAMENAIPVHELTHGLTNRMTGGGTGRCLQTVESGGLGEGWSDAVADWTQQTSAQTQDFVVGQGVAARAGGIRSQPYSTNPQTNTLTYSDIGRFREVHQIGEVWANILHNVYAELVNELGFSPNALTDPTGSEGNVVFMHLLIDGLAIQPCNPTTLDARDAIIQADVNRFNGANECTLRKAFASRGLGLNATPDFQDDDTVPANCQ
ncbi:putative extracellular elastinolytic metalloproteinase precursor [Moniliophthora roreri MCA 2997]|uniref:Extracellular metalloproteinase n=1 Tax=Moniliophthora roreri (strain MCA 2997) TaxID=1381753 RepID=V2XMY9_MONRO|nr:putative extracellular elastinolytic metalloproteinase precursor [Moniliophthora roreri MCA 2997]